jgi:predicted aspartyl protease
VESTFDHQRGLVDIPVFVWGPIGTYEYRFAVDLGSTHSSMAAIHLEALGYQEPSLDRRRTVRMALGATRAGQVKVTRFEAFDRALTDFPLLWMPHQPGGMIDGLLGLDFMRGLILTVNFARGRISLKPPRPLWQFWR